MRRVAFLSLSDPTGWVIDDELAVLPLARRGIKVDTVPWNRPSADWGRYELVVIRSTWDYQHHADDFLRTLEAIERVRGGIRPDRDGYVVTWLTQADQRPRAELLRDGVQALVWLRDFTR